MKVITNLFNKIISNYKYGLIMTLICIFIAVFDLVTKGITTNINVTVINGFLSLVIVFSLSNYFGQFSDKKHYAQGTT